MFFTVLSLLAAFRSKKQFDEVGVLKVLFWLGMTEKEPVSQELVLARLAQEGVVFSSAAVAEARRQVGPHLKVLELLADEEMKTTALRMADAIGLGRKVYPLGQQMIVYLVSYNRDYDEWIEAYRTEEEAIHGIARAFDIAPPTEDFWSEVQEEYEGASWKGFGFWKLNTATLETGPVRPWR